MDRNAKIIISFAITILIPTFVYFAVYTFIPDAKSASPQLPTQPTRPACPQTSTKPLGQTQQGYYYDSCYTLQQKYQRDKVAYDEAFAQYQRDLDKSSKDAADRQTWRIQLALILGVLTMLAILFAKDIKALVAGLAGGSTVTLFGATTAFYSLSDSNKGAVTVGLLFAAFLILTVLLQIVDTIIPGDSFKIRNPIPEATNLPTSPPK